MIFDSIKYRKTLRCAIPISTSVGNVKFLEYLLDKIAPAAAGVGRSSSTDIAYLPQLIEAVNMAVKAGHTACVQLLCQRLRTTEPPPMFL